MEGKSLQRLSEGRSIDEYATKYEFLKYAARQWVTHFNQAGDNLTKLCELALEICNPQSRQFHTWFPLHIKSPQHTFARMVKSWLKQDQWPEAYPRELTSLHVTSYLGLPKIIRLLLARDDVYCDSKDEDGRTPLTWAARFGRPRAVKLLLAQDDVDPNSRDKYGYTPLHWAVKKSHFQAANFLLGQDNTDPNSKDDVGTTPLLCAMKESDLHIVKLMLKQDNVDPNCKDTEGRTPLSLAAQLGNYVALDLLLARDDINLDSTDDQHILTWWAETRGNSKMGELLQAKTAALDLRVKERINQMTQIPTIAEEYE